MHRSLLDLLRCSACRAAPLELMDETPAGDDVLTGSLRCGACGQAYRIVDGIPDMLVEPDAGAPWRRAWDFKWNHIAGAIRYDEDGDREFDDKINHAGTFDGDLTGKVILDAGCGSGQDAARLAARGARVVAVDQTDTICQARDHNRGETFATRLDFIRADLFALPFRDGAFDAVFAHGVLHHTPDTRRAFGSVAAALKPGGAVSVWVYDRTQYYRPFELFWRPVLSRLPLWALAAVLKVIDRPWRWIYVYRQFVMKRLNPWPGNSVAEFAFDVLSLGHLLYLLTDYHLHIAVREPDAAVRFQHTFDCYCPRYAWGHDEAELFEWFEEEGIDPTAIATRRCGMVGVKRAAQSP